MGPHFMMLHPNEYRLLAKLRWSYPLRSYLHCHLRRPLFVRLLNQQRLPPPSCHLHHQKQIRLLLGHQRRQL